MSRKTRSNILIVVSLVLASVSLVAATITGCGEDDSLGATGQRVKDEVSDLVCEFCDRCPDGESYCPDMSLADCLESYEDGTDQFWANFDDKPECADPYINSKACQYGLSCEQYADSTLKSEACRSENRAYSECMSD